MNNSNNIPLQCMFHYYEFAGVLGDMGDNTKLTLESLESIKDHYHLLSNENQTANG